MASSSSTTASSAGARDRRPLAERRRRRRGAAAQLQGRPPVDRDREPDRAGQDRRARRETGPRAPGTYTLDVDGPHAQGAPEPEGRWRWIVNAVDDRGQASRAERVFYLNNTLGYLRVSPSRVVVRRRGGALRVAFRLAHPATVTLKIRTASGATVQTVRRKLRAGTTSIRWNGRYGSGSAPSPAPMSPVCAR